MRLWSLHPKYLDPQGLVALWREALLAQAVLRGETRGYKNHPQLDRFSDLADPASMISAYLAAVFDEASARGYSFNETKIGPRNTTGQIVVTSGQIAFEWRHLLRKLKDRSPAIYDRWCSLGPPESHPLFLVTPGEIQPWEKGDK